VALGLAAEGWSVGVVGRTRQTLAETAALCREAGGRDAIGVVADVTVPSAVRSAVAHVTERLGPVDLLVANAGSREQRPTAPWLADADDWWRVVETNLRGVHLLDSAVLPSMVERGSGRLLHVGSGMGYETYPEWSAYGASKAALARLTDATAAALDGSGVTLLEVSPGLVRTDMTEEMWGPAEEQPWAPAELMVEVVRRFARGELDALHGCFVHARRDDLDDLVRRADHMRAAGARTLRLRPYGPEDPLG
jgi:NAD(P)-dependent dehydrogenase (short-subunit alcohol dehydrogenase family)